MAKRWRFESDWEYQPTGTVLIDVTKANSYPGRKKLSIPEGRPGMAEIKSFLAEVHKGVVFREKERRRRNERNYQRQVEKQRKEQAERRQ